jgi:hypothetical protein
MDGWSANVHEVKFGSVHLRLFLSSRGVKFWDVKSDVLWDVRDVQILIKKLITELVYKLRDEFIKTN